MILNIKSKKYQEMLSIIKKLEGKQFDPEMPQADIMTMHRTGRLVWKLYWTLSIRNERKSSKGADKWRYRLQLTPEFRVNKKNAKLDIANIPMDKIEVAKASLEFVKKTGPFFKGFSAMNMKHIENGKKFLWGQIQAQQKYFSTMRRLTQEIFNQTIDNECPPEVKILIQNQK